MKKTASTIYFCICMLLFGKTDASEKGIPKEAQDLIDTMHQCNARAQFESITFENCTINIKYKETKYKISDDKEIVKKMEFTIDLRGARKDKGDNNEFWIIPPKGVKRSDGVNLVEQIGYFMTFNSMTIENMEKAFESAKRICP